MLVFLAFSVVVADLELMVIGVFYLFVCVLILFHASVIRAFWVVEGMEVMRRVMIRLFL